MLRGAYKQAIRDVSSSGDDLGRALGRAVVLSAKSCFGAIVLCRLGLTEVITDHAGQRRPSSTI